MKISMQKCKTRLSILWFLSSGVLFLNLLYQTVIGLYGINSDEVWGWMLPTLMPTLSLMIGVWVADTLWQQQKTKKVDKFFYRLVFWISLSYLLLVFLHLNIHPFTNVRPLDLMKQSNLWLGPIQGLVSASLGAFFVRQEHQERDESSSNDKNIVVQAE